MVHSYRWLELCFKNRNMGMAMQLSLSYLLSESSHFTGNYNTTGVPTGVQQGVPRNSRNSLDPDGTIADRYGVSGYPTGFLIDRSGIIANRVIGELPPEIMEPLLYPLW